MACLLPTITLLPLVEEAEVVADVHAVEKGELPTALQSPTTTIIAPLMDFKLVIIIPVQRVKTKARATKTTQQQQTLWVAAPKEKNDS